MCEIMLRLDGPNLLFCADSGAPHSENTQHKTLDLSREYEGRQAWNMHALCFL